MMQTGYAPQTPLCLFRDRERAAIRRRALFAGFAMLIFLGAQSALSEIDVLVALALSGGKIPTMSDWIGQHGAALSVLYSAVQYTVMILIPIFIGFVFCRKAYVRPIAKEKVPASHALGLLAAGLSACVFANFVATVIAQALSSVGFESPVIPSSQDGSLTVLLLSLISTAVLPAILEELLFRGVVLQLLRPAGDRTALILSALLFGMAHGTVEQIPFAFIVGLACGYYVLKTGNLFLGMVLHFLNNAMAVLLDYATLGASDAESVAWTYGAFVVLTALGVIGWLFLRQRAPHALAPVVDGRTSHLSVSERRRTVWCAPTILIYLIAMLLLTLLATQTVRIEEWLEHLRFNGGGFYG